MLFRSGTFGADTASYGNLVNTATTNAYNAIYNSTYQTQLRAGKTPGQAATAAADAARPYNPNIPATFLSASDAKKQAAILNDAQIAAYKAAGPNAGATAIAAYVASQQQVLLTAKNAGLISAGDYSAQSQRLGTLEGAAKPGTLSYMALQAAALGAYTPGTKFKGWGMDTSWQGPSDRIGVKGSEDLGNGLKAIYQIELGVDITNATRDNNIANGNRGSTTNNSGFAFRNTFVGLAGDWGTFLMGRNDTPLKISTGRLDLFSDTLADYNNTIGFQDLRADSAVAYISPSLSGFQLLAAIVPSGGATALGTYNENADSVAGAYSIAATYKNGPFYGSAAYESLESKNFETDNVNYQLLYGKTAENDSKWRIGLGLLDWNGFSLTGIYEQRKHILGAPENADGNFFQIQGGYAFGSSMIKAMWGRADLNRCADPNNVGFRYTCPSSIIGQYFAQSILVQNNQKTSWAVGYDYNFSKRTSAFALYTDVSDKNANADWSGFSIGMMHSF